MYNHRKESHEIPYNRVLGIFHFLHAAALGDPVHAQASARDSRIELSCRSKAVFPRMSPKSTRFQTQHAPHRPRNRACSISVAPKIASIFTRPRVVSVSTRFLKFFRSSAGTTCTISPSESSEAKARVLCLCNSLFLSCPHSLTASDHLHFPVSMRLRINPIFLSIFNGWLAVRRCCQTFETSELSLHNASRP